MKLVVDSHTHTLASSHAYSTVSELAQAASARNLALLAITDHAPEIEDGAPMLHFMNYHVLPKEMYGVQMRYGVELNILDFTGRVDFDADLLKRQDLCIASFHEKATQPGTLAENTAAYLGAMDNPYVNIIGHPDDGNIPVDFLALVQKAKETNVLIEVNNLSLRAAYYRKNTRENLCTILALCKRYEVPVVLGTDAHFAGAVGDFAEAQALLEEQAFPELLVANTSVEKYLALLARRREA